MVVRTNDKRGIIIAVIVVLVLIVGAVVGYLVYKNSRKGGFKCTEKGCVFDKSETTTEADCKKTCNKPVASAMQEYDQEPEPRFVCSARGGKRVWVQVETSSADYSHAWTGGQIVSHANMGYCHPENQNEYGVCPDMECNTDDVYVLPWGYTTPLLWSNWLVISRPWWWRRHHHHHGGKGCNDRSAKGFIQGYIHHFL